MTIIVYIKGRGKQGTRKRTHWQVEVVEHTLISPFFFPSGWIRDVTDSYPVSLSVLAGTFYLATALWCVLPLARNYDMNHEDQTKEYEQLEEMENKEKEQQQKDNEKLSLLNGRARQDSFTSQ